MNRCDARGLLSILAEEKTMRDSGNTLLKLLEDNGGEKKISKEQNIRQLTQAACRITMRFPDQSVHAALIKLHRYIKQLSFDFTDADIDWMLGGALTARGNFRDAAHFRQFFNTDPTGLSSSRLSTALESVLTSIAYRVIDADWDGAQRMPIIHFLPDLQQ